MQKLKTPLSKSEIQKLKIGQEVFLSGKIYTARDQAHKRLVETIHKHRKLPFDLKGQIIYYCGPARTPPGKAIGSCGPTTSSRMDGFTLPLLKAGLRGMIGKGSRCQEVINAIKKYKAVYFLAYSGCGALLSRCVSKKRLVAYAGLGPEAIYELEVKDFPLIVAVDAKGRSVYAQK